MNTPQSPGGMPAVANGETDVEQSVRTLHNYIGGRWVASAAKETKDIINPATGELLSRVPLGGAADVDQAVQAALKAFPGWRATPPVHRVKPFFKLKALLE